MSHHLSRNSITNYLQKICRISYHNRILCIARQHVLLVSGARVHEINKQTKLNSIISFYSINAASIVALVLFLDMVLKGADQTCSCTSLTFSYNAKGKCDHLKIPSKIRYCKKDLFVAHFFLFSRFAGITRHIKVFIKL